MHLEFLDNQGITQSGACFLKAPKIFGPEKPFVKLRPAYSVRLISSYAVKGREIKITVKFRASRRLRFEDTKRNMSLEKVFFKFYSSSCLQ